MKEYYNPHEPGSDLWAEAVGKYIAEAIDEDSVEEYNEPDPGRWHLGASEIGKPCSRAIWYSFRWAVKIIHKPALYRLFNRGHLEEHRFVHRLRRIGIDSRDRNPETGKQYQIEHPQEPHYGGSLDGIAWIPFAGLWVITEFKTHNDKSFEKLVKKGVRVAKPEHYQQMCAYGKVYGLKFGLYVAVNKNTDELYVRLVPLDWSFAEITDSKAIAVIRSQTPPRRYSESPMDHVCKFCNFYGVCHRGQPIYRSCRSCVHAVPNRHNKEWTCQHPAHNQEIPRDVVRTGCADYAPIC